MLAAALAYNPDVSWLSLTYNAPVEARAAAGIARVFSSPISPLSFIELSDCGIDSAAAVELATGLKYSNHLEELLMSTNPIGDVGATAIADALKVNSVLELLDLTRNGIE